MRPKLAGLRRRDRRRRRRGPHPRRAHRPLAAARAVHRRRRRHQDRGRAVSLAELQRDRGGARDRDLRALRRSSSCAARARASGTSDGNEYLDLLVRHLGHEPRPLPPARGRGRARAGRRADARQQPLLHRARDAPGRAALAQSSLGGKVFFCNSGAEANEAAIKLARKRAARAARSSSLLRRLPRAHLRRAVGDAAGGQAGAVRAAGARLPRRRRRRRGDAGRRSDAQTAAVLLEPIQGEGGVHVAPRRACCVGRARGLRRARRGADLRRDPDRDGPHGHAVGLRADAGACPTR